MWSNDIRWGIAVHSCLDFGVDLTQGLFLTYYFDKSVEMVQDRTLCCSNSDDDACRAITSAQNACGAMTSGWGIAVHRYIPYLLIFAEIDILISKDC